MSNGVLFKGNMEEGSYTLIKTTDGWVLKGKTSYVGFNFAGRPQGEWVDKGRNLWKCSNCEMVIYSESEQDRNEFHKWCSRCGARMKGADDEF